MTKEVDFTDIFKGDIELLKKYRDIMWSSQGKVSFFAYQNFQDLPELLEQREEFKEFVPSELFEDFEKEFQMTISLLEKCLNTAKNKREMPPKEEAKIIIDNILEKIGEAKDNTNSEEIIEALRSEDVTARRTLEKLGLSEEQIKKALDGGFKVDSVLDVEQNQTLK